MAEIRRAAPPFGMYQTLANNGIFYYQPQLVSLPDFERIINSISFLNNSKQPSFWIGRKWWVSNHIYQVKIWFIIIQVIYKKKHVKNWLIWELLGLRLEFIITIVVDIQTLRWRLRFKFMYQEPIFDLHVLKEKMSSKTRRCSKENGVFQESPSYPKMEILAKTVGTL